MNGLSLDNLQTAVTAALKSWGKTLDTETKSLQQLLLVQNQMEQISDSLPNALRHAIDQVLLDSIDLLAEQDEMGAKVLNGRFIDNQITRDVANQLHASPDQVNRWQRLALEQLTQLLWQQEQALRQNRIAQLEANLPAATYNKLFGLQADHERLIGRLLSNDTPWLIAITGIGGIGKTSLADDVVRAMLPTLTFQHIAWVRVESQPMSGQTLPPEQAFDRAMSSLAAQLWPGQASSEAPPQRWQRLRQTCQSQPHLIVVDNLETEEQITYFGEKLLPLTNPSRFLLTSRARAMGTTAVYTHTLHELPLPDAAALIRDHATTIGLDDLARATEDTIAAIYAASGGNPLALKLVVSLAAVLPLPQILADLAHNRVGPIEDLYRHIYWEAWHSLSSEAQTLLQAMPLVAATGALPEQIQAMSGLDDGGFWTAVHELSARSLLEIQGNIQQRRYGIHRLTETFLRTEIVRWEDNP